MPLPWVLNMFMLSGDKLVDTEKIGSGNFYW
jgi:hypothetical protein